MDQHQQQRHQAADDAPSTPPAATLPLDRRPHFAAVQPHTAAWNVAPEDPWPADEQAIGARCVNGGAWQVLTAALLDTANPPFTHRLDVWGPAGPWRALARAYTNAETATQVLADLALERHIVSCWDMHTGRLWNYRPEHPHGLDAGVWDCPLYLIAAELDDTDVAVGFHHSARLGAHALAARVGARRIERIVDLLSNVELMELAPR